MFAVGAEDDGLAALQTCTRLDPRCTDAWILFGIRAARRGWIDVPIEMFQRACDLEPERVEAHLLLGQALLGADRIEDAASAFEQALTLQPGETQALAGLARICLRKGAPDAARELLVEAVFGPRPASQVATAWGVACRAVGEAAAAIGPLERALSATRDRWARVQILHELGECAMAAGDPQRAVDAHHAANRARGLSFDVDALHAETDERIGAFQGPPAEVAQWSGPRPLLIVGLPRSGTTLVERILCGHPRVRTAGELPTLSQLDGVRRKEPEHYTVQRAAEQYAKLLGLGDVVVDKCPDNAAHLGLVSQYGSGARAIWVVRDPVDTLWSCYRQPFSDGLPWATRLDWLVEVWRDRMRLLSHWRQAKPIPLRVVRYEALVTDPESEIRAMLDFAGLTFHPDCLTPHKTRGEVATASALQVRRPLHAGHVGRSKPAEPWLEELVALRR